MLCPNCGKPMNLVSADNQVIFHCTECGASFFEENGINRVTLDTAKQLAKDKNTDEVLGSAKICPKDHSQLKLIHDEAIPNYITLLGCDKCHGIFAYPDDLIHFKEAQKVKIEFFKVWHQPLPSLKAVLVISFTALTLIGSAYAFSTYMNKSSQQIAASDVIKKINISKSGRFLLITFSTNGQFKSNIIFRDKTNETMISKNISKTFSNIHYLVTDEININNNITYQIYLFDKSGRETRTEEKQLAIQ